MTVNVQRFCGINLISKERFFVEAVTAYVSNRKSALENFNRKLFKIKQFNFSKTSVSWCAVFCTLCHRFPYFKSCPILRDFLEKLDFEKIIYRFHKYMNCQNSIITWNFDSSTTYDVKMRSIERSWTYFLENLWRDVSACVSKLNTFQNWYYPP